MLCWRHTEIRNAEWREEEHRENRMAGIPQSRVDRLLEGKVMKILRLNQLNVSSNGLDLLPNAWG